MVTFKKASHEPFVKWAVVIGFFAFITWAITYEYKNPLGTPDYAQPFYFKATWIFYLWILGLFGACALVHFVKPFGYALNHRLPRWSKLLFEQPLSVGEALALVWYFALNVQWFNYFWNEITENGLGGPEGDLPKSFTFARTLGHLNDVNISLLFLPVARNSIWYHCFGMSFERTVSYHRWVGRVVVVSVVAHMLAWCISWAKLGIFVENAITYTGYIAQEYGDWSTPYAIAAAFIAMTMAVTSYSWFRRQKFEVFYYVHHLFIVFLVLANIHSWNQWNYLIPGFGIYFLDRMARVWISRQRATIVSLRQEPGRITHLEITKPGFSSGPAQFVFINIPQISVLQWHPFSVSSGPGKDTWTHHVRDMGADTWTRALFDLAGTNADFSKITIRVDGPYGAMSHSPLDSDVFVGIAGGIGVTPVVNTMRWVRAQLSDSSVKRRLTKAYFLWSIRDTSMLELSCIKEFFADVGTEDKNSLIEFKHFVTAGNGTPLTASSSLLLNAQSSPLTSPPSASNSVIDYDVIFSEIRQMHPSARNIVVFVCGPSTMMNSVRAACAKCSDKTVTFHIHSETFAL